MTKTTLSITIDTKVYKELKKQALLENRNTSNMIETMARTYLNL